MTNPEDTQQDTEFDPESSTDEAAADVNEEPSEEGVTADYQTRLQEFDDVESVPVVSVPVESSQLDDSDLEVRPPGGGSG